MIEISAERGGSNACWREVRGASEYSFAIANHEFLVENLWVKVRSNPGCSAKKRCGEGSIDLMWTLHLECVVDSRWSSAADSIVHPLRIKRWVHTNQDLSASP